MALGFGMPASSKRASAQLHSGQAPTAPTGSTSTTSIPATSAFPPAAISTPPSASSSATTRISTAITSRATVSPSPTSPLTPTSKIPRFLQSPLQRDRSKSLSVHRPPSAASSSAPHSTSTSANSHSTSSSGGGCRSGRFLGLGGSKDGSGGLKERDRQRIREAECAVPSAPELLTLHEGTASPTSYDFDDPPSSPPSAYATARPRTRSDPFRKARRRRRPGGTGTTRAGRRWNCSAPRVRARTERDSAGGSRTAPPICSSRGRCPAHSATA
ncbi:hypothetical protein DFH09DRAFT_486288 [Mycena vulgaris]|nr:hypothetical protein DFH09DRAFT_486288 [Mycena vulgaris]